MKNLSNQLLNRWTIGGIFVFAVVLFGIVFLIIYSSRPEKDLALNTTAVIAIIPAPTVTPEFTPTLESTLQPEVDQPPSPPPEVSWLDPMFKSPGLEGMA